MNQVSSGVLLAYYHRINRIKIVTNTFFSLITKEIGKMQVLTYFYFKLIHKLNLFCFQNSISCQWMDLNPYIQQKYDRNQQSFKIVLYQICKVILTLIPRQQPLMGCFDVDMDIVGQMASLFFFTSIIDRCMLNLLARVNGLKPQMSYPPLSCIIIKLGCFIMASLIVNTSDIQSLKDACHAIMSPCINMISNHYFSPHCSYLSTLTVSSMTKLLTITLLHLSQDLYHISSQCLYYQSHHPFTMICTNHFHGTNSYVHHPCAHPRVQQSLSYAKRDAREASHAY